ncbi:hypothetical protein F0L17_10245 [Streptomyces sp. TRM43335]|uniref:Uncharacterized protein n=1 Tax=Streptomyces taklimakanensis TaxID=2569853 RepID=A0A6G2BB58_9ACTN|nr:hypothetical protein [Streptomyces taklimakanensis]MTE19498.1 hypothetical protein [Streptomyces taklimakanensis]
MPVRTAWLLNRTENGTGQSRADTRLAPTGTMTPAGQLATRGGVIPGSPDGAWALSGLYVYGQSAGMTAMVASGRAVVQGDESAGAYPVAVTEYTPLTFADGDPNNPRIDLVVLRVYDETQDTESGRAEAALEIVQGTPAATPKIPATPRAALALAAVRVPAGASEGTGGIDWTSAVGDLRRATVAVGGIVPEEWPRDIPGSYPGQYRDIGAGGLQRWDGTAWQPYPPTPRWREWTPEWTTSTGRSTPSFGNATVQCRYVHTGTLVHASLGLYFGSTTRFGSGGSGDNWRFSLPVRASGTSHAVGFAGLQLGLRERRIARVRLTTPGHLELEVSSGDLDGTASRHGGLVDAVTPWVWESGTHIAATLTYESAEPAE